MSGGGGSGSGSAGAGAGPKDDAELMQHADGELDEAADREVELRLGQDPRARGVVDAIGEVGELMRGHLELAADAVPARRFDQIWREIDKQLDLAAAAVPAPVAATAVAPRERAASESMIQPLPAQASAVRRLLHWLERKRGYVLTAFVSAGAVAAIALITRPSSGGTAGGDRIAPVLGPIDVRPVSHRPAELESLETPGGTGTVMRVQDEDGDTTVIWVTPEDTVEGL
jgi:hypothetical protein